MIAVTGLRPPRGVGFWEVNQRLDSASFIPGMEEVGNY
jgi:hypothetical protein